MARISIRVIKGRSLGEQWYDCEVSRNHFASEVAIDDQPGYGNDRNTTIYQHVNSCLKHEVN